MAIRTISNFPSNGVLNDERDEYLRLFELGATRTSTGNIYFTSTTSGYVYDITGTIYADQGENGLMNLLFYGEEGSTRPKLVDYSVIASDISKIKAATDVIIAAGTGTNILISLDNVTEYEANSKYTFVASVNNNGSATTININGLGAKNLYKPNTTTAPNIISGKVYTVWYNGTSFFLQASAEGNAVAGDVLAGKTFSNDDDSGISGTMINRGAYNITPSTSNIVIPSGYHNGSGVVYTDLDLTENNIKRNVNIFGVNGQFNGSPDYSITYNDTFTLASPNIGSAKTDASNNNVVSSVKYSPSGGLIAVCYAGFSYNGRLIEIYRKMENSYYLASSYTFTETYFADWINDNLLVYIVEDGTNFYLKTVSISESGVIGATHNTIKTYIKSTYGSAITLESSSCGNWISITTTNNYLLTLSYNSDSSFTERLISVLTYYPIKVSFTPDSKYMFVALYTDTSSNLRRYVISSSTSIAYSGSHSITGTLKSINFAGRNTSPYKFVIATISNIQIGTFTPSSTLTITGTYVFSCDSAYLPEHDARIDNDGRYIAVATRGADNLRNVILKANSSFNSISFIGNVTNGYGNSVSFDPTGKYIAFGTKSGGTFCVMLNGSNFKKSTMTDMEGSTFHKIYTVQGQYPRQIEVSGNRYQIINSSPTYNTSE